MRNDGVRQYISKCIADGDIMSVDTYKQIIYELVKESADLEYLKAVYSFADTYPNGTTVSTLGGGAV